MNPIEFPMIFSTSSKVLRFFHTYLFPETSVPNPGFNLLDLGFSSIRGLKLLGRNLDNPDQRIAQVPGPWSMSFFRMGPGAVIISSWSDYGWKYIRPVKLSRLRRSF